MLVQYLRETPNLYSFLRAASNFKTKKLPNFCIDHCITNTSVRNMEADSLTNRFFTAFLGTLDLVYMPSIHHPYLKQIIYLCLSLPLGSDANSTAKDHSIFHVNTLKNIILLLLLYLLPPNNLLLSPIINDMKSSLYCTGVLNSL